MPDDKPQPIHFTLASSWLTGATYDPETQDLTVSTISGRDYTHPGVPPDVVAGLRAAPSPGSFYNSEIKNTYV